MTNKNVYPLPEALSRRDREDENVAGGWKVSAARNVRFSGSTDLKTRSMRTSVADTDFGRLQRAHELVVAKSGLIGGIGAGTVRAVVDSLDYKHLTQEILQAAEEVRMLRLMQLADFNIAEYYDGSEQRVGEELSQSGTNEAYQAAVLAMASYWGTKGSDKFLYGIKKHKPEWVKPLKKLRLDLTKRAKVVSQRRAYTMSNTEPWPDNDGSQIVNLTKGFSHTIQFACIIARHIGRRPTPAPQPGEGEEYGNGKLEDLEDQVSNGWAELNFDKSQELTVFQRGALSKRRRSSATGRRVAHPTRMFTDPHKRVFSTPRKQPGAVVLIDQSGSMSLSMQDIEQMVDAAPGALVIGYSHRRNGIPNIWVHAEKGKRTKELHQGNTGNGCDGTALAYAISRRKPGEPIIWVTDGGVTDQDDDFTDDLVAECVNLVSRYGVHMAYDTGEAIAKLNGPRSVLRKVNFVGHLKAHVLQNR